MTAHAVSAQFAQQAISYRLDEFWRLSDHHGVLLDSSFGVAPALSDYDPIKIFFQHPLNRVGGGPHRRAELGVQWIAVFFLQIVNDETGVRDSLMPIHDVGQLPFGRCRE